MSGRFSCGGRSSARETAARVAAGAVARLVIPEVTLVAYVSEIGGDTIDHVVPAVERDERMVEAGAAHGPLGDRAPRDLRLPIVLALRLDRCGLTDTSRRRVRALILGHARLGTRERG